VIRQAPRHILGDSGVQGAVGAVKDVNEWHKQSEGGGTYSRGMITRAVEPNMAGSAY
jgi:hypothetical protein